VSEEVEDFDLSNYRAERNGEPTPAEPVAEKVEEIKDAEPVPEAEEVEPEESAPEEKEQDEKPKKKDRLQGRFDKLTKEIYDLRAQLADKPIPAAIKAPAVSDGKPKIEAFESLEEFQEALTDWKLDQRESAKVQVEKQRESQRQAEQARQRIEQARSKYEDFDEVALDPSLRVSQAMYDVMLESDIGADVLYFLGNNPTEAERIAKLSPASAAREIGKIEAKLEAKPKAEPKVTKAPPPVKPLAGRAAPSFDPETTTSQSEYRKWRERQQSR
jgi:hypothetical protein